MTPGCWSAWLKLCRCAAAHRFGSHLSHAAILRVRTPAMLAVSSVSHTYFPHLTAAALSPPLLQQPTNQHLLDLKQCTGW